MNTPDTRIETLERTVRRQGRGLIVLGSLLTLAVLAGTTMRAADVTHVVIDKPVKIVIEGINHNFNSYRAIPISIKQPISVKTVK